MRKFFTALIVIPLALIFIIFAVANRHFVTVSFDPFNSTTPTVAVTLPLFVVIIAVAILGVIAGGTTTWFRQRRWRRATAGPSGAVSRRPLRVRRARQAGRDVVEPAPSADVRSRSDHPNSLGPWNHVPAR